MLDGLEIFKALTHLMPYDDLDLGSGNVDPKGKTTDQVKEEKKKLKMKYYAGTACVWSENRRRVGGGRVGGVRVGGGRVGGMRVGGGRVGGVRVGGGRGVE